MRIEVINTGTELLLGNVLNSHAAYFGQQLFKLGARIDRQTCVPDGTAIRDALLEAFPRCDIILVTGGLGPTTDDITREITAELLGRELRLDESIIKAIRLRLKRRNIPLQERMKRQAMVPEGATILKNDNGTAPGLYLPATASAFGPTPHIFLLPGPPRELKPMFEEKALPILKTLLPVSEIECRIYRVIGMGESIVEQRIGLQLSMVEGLEVGYCARPNEVDLRLIAHPSLLDVHEARVVETLGEHIASRSEEPLESVIVRELTRLSLTVATAESCTGGLLANRITNVSGASAVFPQGYVTYSNKAKAKTLGVPGKLLKAHGAVSAEVAKSMAKRARKLADTDFALAVTGIAGPTGGTPKKPVGTVFVALAERRQKVEVHQYAFNMDRETFKTVTSQVALDLLRRRLGKRQRQA